MFNKKNFLFEDQETGEVFIVERKDYKEAEKVAKDFFTEPRFIKEISYDYAEMLGIDTY